MKTLSSVLVLVLLGIVNALAQTSPIVSAPPDITVLQKSWRPFVRNPALDEDPFNANTEQREYMKEQRNNEIQNTIRARGSETREAPPPRTVKFPKPLLPSSVTYEYTIRIKNTGTKTIRAVDWGYMFSDPDTQKELGRHQHSSKIKIRPGEDKNLVGRSASPPTKIVSARNAGRELKDSSSERIVIYRVEYDDGSAWQNPAK
jgi:hypothetical protein